MPRLSLSAGGGGLSAIAAIHVGVHAVVGLRAPTCDPASRIHDDIDAVSRPNSREQVYIRYNEKRD
jgi:hypothetical protein